MSEAGSEAGFTLLETLVTVAVMGLIATLVFPQVGQAYRALEHRQSVRLLAADLHRLRADALRSGREQSVLPLHDGAGYGMTGGRVRHLPEGQTMKGDEIRFFPDGSAVGGVLEIQSDRQVHAVRIDPATGSVGVLGGS